MNVPYEPGSAAQWWRMRFAQVSAERDALAFRLANEEATAEWRKLRLAEAERVLRHIADDEDADPRYAALDYFVHTAGSAPPTPSEST